MRAVDLPTGADSAAPVRLRSEESPTTIPEHPDVPEHAVADDLIEFFERSRWHLVIASMLASPAIVAVTWPLSSHTNMLWFLAVHQIAVLAMATSFALPERRRGEPRMPAPSLAGLVVTHIVLASAPFFDTAAARSADYFFGVGVVLFAVAAGTLAVLGPLRSVARLALMGVLLPYLLAAFVFGHPWLGLATTFFVALTAGLAVNHTAEVFEELTSMRRRASARADHAEAVATTDALTGLTNRYGLELLDGQLLQKEVTGIFVDLDKFKEVNDTLGHRAGDDVLVEVARRVRRYVRPSDTVVRLGGDEFFILLWSDNEIPAMDIADRIRQAVDRPIDVDGGVAEVSASIGLSRQNPGVLNLEDLIQRADEALYMAKSLGRNQVIASSIRLSASRSEPEPPAPCERSVGFTSTPETDDV